MRFFKKNDYEELELDEEEQENLEEIEDFEEEELPGEEKESLWIKITRILIIYLIVGLVSWNFFYFIFNSKYCNIKEVIIKGNSVLDKEDVFYLSHIKLGGNIFRLDVKKSIDFLRQDPWIKEVEIKKIIPHRVVVSSEERKPSAIIIIEEEYFLVDKEGRILSRADSGNKFELPLISGLKITQARIGEVISSQEFKVALEIINSANIVIPDNFYEIEVLDSDNFMVYGKMNELIIRAHQAEEIIGKGNLLREAYEKIIKERLLTDYIDLRFKDRVIIKLKE